jgi:hypothetical protein
MCSVKMGFQVFALECLAAFPVLYPLTDDRAFINKNLVKVENGLESYQAKTDLRKGKENTLRSSNLDCIFRWRVSQNVPAEGGPRRQNFHCILSGS